MLSWTIDVPAGGEVILTFSVTLDDTFPDGTTHLPNVVIVTGPGSNCPAASEDPDCDTDTTVEAAPDLNVLKEVATNDGAFGPTSSAEPGDTVNYRITVDNSGDADANDIPVSDDIDALLAHSDYDDNCNLGCGFDGHALTWTIDVPAGGEVILTFSVTSQTRSPRAPPFAERRHRHGPRLQLPGSDEVIADCDTTTDVSVSCLTIDKTNDAPPETSSCRTVTAVTADRGRRLDGHLYPDLHGRRERRHGRGHRR